MAEYRMLKLSLRRLATSATVAALGAAVAAPAAADWLVTRDGARIETKGPWRVEGKRVLFDLPNGTLSMLRADQVDLDQSAVATAEARGAAVAAAKPEPPVKREPVIRLTEKDIPPSGELPPEDAAAADTGSADTGGKAALDVISWEKTESPDGQGVEIFGTIKNGSENMIVSPSLLVAIYDADGGLLATTNGVINSPQIAAGKTANFRVTFGGLTDFASVKFDAQGRGYKQRAANADVVEDAAPEEVPAEEPDQDLDFQPPPGNPAP